MSEDTQLAVRLFPILSGLFYVALLLLMVAVQINFILDKKKPKEEGVTMDKKIKKRVLVDCLLFLVEIAIVLYSAIMSIYFGNNFLFPIFLFIILVIFIVRIYIWKKK